MHQDIAHLGIIGDQEAEPARHVEPFQGTEQPPLVMVGA